MQPSSQRHRHFILAISGDETQHQLWRLNATFGREFSPSLRADAHLFINLLIGTNNIANVNRHSVEETCDGVLAIARFLLRSNTHARLLLNAMLPRETDHPRRIVAGQPRPRARPTPQRSALELTRDLIRANELLRTDVIARLEAEFGARRVRFVDCGAPFRPHGWRLEDLNAQTYSVDGTLMPDGVHPSLNGSRLMADLPRRRLSCVPLSLGLLSSCVVSCLSVTEVCRFQFARVSCPRLRFSGDSNFGALPCD